MNGATNYNHRIAWFVPNSKQTNLLHEIGIQWPRAHNIQLDY